MNDLKVFFEKNKVIVVISSVFLAIILLNYFKKEKISAEGSIGTVSPRP